MSVRGYLFLVRCLCIVNEQALFGAMMGARACTQAMEIISDTARSNIPALGYAGTYAIASLCADAGRDNHRHGMAKN